MRTLPLLAVGLAAVTPLLASCIGGAEDDNALHEQAYEENAAGGKADGGCSGVVVPDRRGFDKRIALTFDDGPNPATTPGVIAILHRHHAPATFFNNGKRYNEAAKAIAAQIAADPDFILGNHTQNHLNLAREPLDVVADEIDRTDALIRAAGETPKYLRFPFGSANCETMQMAKDRGYLVTGWHIDSADWCYAAGGGYCKPSTFKYVPDELRNDLLGYVMSQVKQTGGGIILFHDIHQYTVDHLDEVLTALEQAGYTFVRLDDTSVFPLLNGAPPPPFVGDRCTDDSQCGFTASGQKGRCHPAGFCTISCAGSCPDQSGSAPTFCIADDLNAGQGICVSKAVSQNQLCAALPGTESRLEDRFIGSSSSSPATAQVCAPR